MKAQTIEHNYRYKIRNNKAIGIHQYEWKDLFD